MHHRIFMLITDLQVGGTPLDVFRLATHLDKTRFRVKVVSLAPPGPISQRLAAAGIECDACGARGPWDLRALCRLAHLIRRFRPHVLHSFLLHANVAARVVGPLAGVPAGRIICEIKTVETERRWHLRLDSLTSRLCRLQVANSPAVAEHLRRAAHWPTSRLRIILSAVDLEAIALAEPVSRTALGLSNDDFIVLWVGRFDPAKALETLIEAAALIAPEARVRFVLAGDGATRAQIEAEVRRRGLDRYFQFLGFREDVAGLMKTADLLVLPSRVEGLPTVLVEAAAAGCPALASDIPACRQLLNLRLAGSLRLASPDRPLEWARQIEAEARGTRCPRSGGPSEDLEWFGLERTAGEYAELYDVICQEVTASKPVLAGDEDEPGTL
jgi:glycosyltransferase involved in cell wall biosynthesis